MREPAAGRAFEHDTAGPRDWRGLPVTVMGVGLFGGGVGAIRWLAAQGARVTATDLRDPEQLAPSLAALEGVDVQLRLGEHVRDDFERAAVVVANPAVAPGNPWLRRARGSGAEVTSEVELFLERCPSHVAAVTGTNGKSSTVHALGALSSGDFGRVHCGGNLGGSLLEGLDALRTDDLVVLELSSYQLEALSSRVPRVAEVVALTQVTADHLERHGNLASYRAAKARILELLAPGGTAILPLDVPKTFRPPAGTRVVTHGGPEADLAVERGSFVRRHPDGKAEELGRQQDLRLPGRFQRANILVALGMAHALGASAGALAARVGQVTGLPHRLEDLGRRAGIRVIDNGVSTTPESTLAALEELFEEGAPLTVLVGGAAKRDLDLTELASTLAAHAALTVAFGAARGAIARALGAHGGTCLTTEGVVEAVRLGLGRTPRGGTLVLSPACASFDAWPNFRARAEAFRAALPPPDETRG